MKNMSKGFKQVVVFLVAVSVALLFFVTLMTNFVDRVLADLGFGFYFYAGLAGFFGFVVFVAIALGLLLRKDNNQKK